MASTQHAIPTTLPEVRFSPHSAFWRINREWLTTLSGARAVLLEIAHPLVAAGVAEHSDYRSDPFGRLFRTVNTMTDLAFNRPQAAHRAVRHYYACHRRVKGRLREDVGPYSAGTEYDGNDSALRLWVLATLIDSALLVYELFVRPVLPPERESYYADFQKLGGYLGLTSDQMPPTYTDFQSYMQAMLHSDVLTVGPQARDIARALYAPSLAGRIAWRLSFIGIGLLPAHLRAAFGFEWSEAHERRLHRLAALSRRIRPFLPDLLMVHPTILLAEWQTQ
ncbi:MAG: DUF2236 domain-containing protein [Anaerolineales bacterium]|nr:DUF2236 domain-containing protein [Anaerolineales bacterium]